MTRDELEASHREESDGSERNNPWEFMRLLDGIRRNIRGHLKVHHTAGAYPDWAVEEIAFLGVAINSVEGVYVNGVIVNSLRGVEIGYRYEAVGDTSYSLILEEPRPISVNDSVPA